MHSIGIGKGVGEYGPLARVLPHSAISPTSRAGGSTQVAMRNLIIMDMKNMA